MNIGCDFVDAEGNRVTSIQLVHRDRGTIADAFFDNEKLVKCLVCNDVDKTKFIHEAELLLENSIPVQFKRQPKELEIGPI